MVADAKAYQTRGAVFGRANGGTAWPPAEGGAILWTVRLAPGVAEVVGEDEALVLVRPVVELEEVDAVESRVRGAVDGVVKLLRDGKRKVKLWRCELTWDGSVAYFGEDDEQLWSSDPDEVAAWFVRLASVVMPLDTRGREV